MEKQRIELWPWGGEERVQYTESNMGTHITMCETASQWEFALWLRNSNTGSVST